MALSAGEQVYIYNEDEVVAPPGFHHVLSYDNQIILATDAAMAEATRRAEELKQAHTQTIKREIEELIPGQLYILFAQRWQPEPSRS